MHMCSSIAQIKELVQIHALITLVKNLTHQNKVKEHQILPTCKYMASCSVANFRIYNDDPIGL